MGREGESFSREEIAGNARAKGEQKLKSCFDRLYCNINSTRLEFYSNAALSLQLYPQSPRRCVPLTTCAPRSN